MRYDIWILSNYISEDVFTSPKGNLIFSSRALDENRTKKCMSMSSLSSTWTEYTQIRYASLHSTVSVVQLNAIKCN